MKMSKKCFYLCSYMHGYLRSLYSCVRSFALAYTGMFLRLCVRGNGPAYARSCLHAWALTHIRETPGRSPTLPIFTQFSTVSPPFAILTPFFAILASKNHYIILFIFIPALKHNIPKFHLNHGSNVIFLFAVIIPLC